MEQLQKQLERLMKKDDNPTSQEQIETMPLEQEPPQEEEEGVVEDVASNNIDTPKLDDGDDDFEIGGDDGAEEDDIAILSQQIGLNAKNKEQLKKELSTLKGQLEEFRGKAEAKFANEEVAKLDQFVREGGDLKAFLRLEDEYGSLLAQKEQIESLSDIDAWEVRVRLNLANAGYGEDDIEEQLALMAESTDDAKKLRIGKEFKKNEISNLDTSINNAKTKKDNEILAAQQKGEKFSQSIKAEIDRTDKVGNIRLSVEQKNDLKNENPKEFIKKFFPIDKDGNPIADQWAKSMFLIKYGLDSVKSAYKQGQSKAKREKFDALSNVNGENTYRINPKNGKDNENSEILKGLQSIFQR